MLVKIIINVLVIACLNFVGSQLEVINIENSNPKSYVF
jgi:hypothetical protein